MKIRQFLFAGNLPVTLKSRSTTFILTGGVTTACSVILLLILLFKRLNISYIGLPLVIGLCLLIYGSYIRYSAAKKGYFIVRGTCIKHNFPISTKLGIKSAPNGFGVKSITAAECTCKDGEMTEAEEVDTDIYITVPVVKRREVPNVGQIVEVYVPLDATGYEANDGFMNYNNLYGYKLIQ